MSGEVLYNSVQVVAIQHVLLWFRSSGGVGEHMNPEQS